MYELSYCFNLHIKLLKQTFMYLGFFSLSTQTLNFFFLVSTLIRNGFPLLRASGRSTFSSVCHLPAFLLFKKMSRVCARGLRCKAMSPSIDCPFRKFTANLEIKIVSPGKDVHKSYIDLGFCREKRK